MIKKKVKIERIKIMRLFFLNKDLSPNILYILYIVMLLCIMLLYIYCVVQKEKIISGTWIRFAT